MRTGELRRFHEHPRSGIDLGSKTFLIIRLHELYGCPRVDLLMDGNIETDWLYDFVEDNSEALSG